MSDLAPGDLCEIVPSHDVIWRVVYPEAAGMRVVLVEVDNDLLPLQLPFAPFWRAAGLPRGITAISWTCLRKLPPPPPLEDDDIEHIPVLTEVYW